MSKSKANSSIKKLLDHLAQKGLLHQLELSDEDIADSIWLALQMGVGEVTPQKKPDNKQGQSIPIEIQEIESEKPVIDSEKSIDVITQDSPPIEQQTTRLTKGFPFQVPAAPALQTPLSINRALRPLMRKVPSATKRMLDEEATVNRIAERDIWQPVTKPQPERWLTLELVIEESSSSFIWRELVDDLQQLLENQGAFQTMRLWQVSTQDGQHLQLVRRRKRGQSGRRYHSHRELIHPSGRGLILLVSDCVSELWKNALIYPWLKDWSEKQPIAIVQLFPERLWNSTQLARGRKLFTTAFTPGVANPQLVLKDYPRWLPLDWQNTLLVPVVTLEPEVLKQWSGVVAGVGQAQISAFLFDLAFIKQQIAQVNPQSSEGRPGKGNPEEVETESGAENETEAINIRGQAEALVSRFFATASEPAKSLATMMAAAPVSMPVVNLIRKTLLKEVEPVHVAEFYMGGLLKPIVENEDGQFRVYDFWPGVRQVLNESIGRRRTTEVLDAISQYIAEKIDRPIRSFAALLALLPQYSEKEQAQIFPFAQVAVEVLQNLGGEYAELAEEVADNLAKLDRLPLSDEEDKPFEPILSSCTFEVVTIELEETRTVEFVVATLERQSQVRLWWEFWKSPEKWVIKRRKRQATSIIEVLPEGLELELMEIPGGTFLMGTDDQEIERLCKKYDSDWFRAERPQHRVTIEPFSMGRYPITQAQWKAIAQRTDLKVNIDLEPNPSSFKDDPPQPPLQEGERAKTRWDRPVETVNWYQAKEFCARLSKLTGKPYRLPTEAEWEYACRAGTTTPFHFGETITGDLANYNASYTYESEPKGEYRDQTTPVGYFQAANAFGLFDMHGNVWEWCQDDWHDNYEGAPADGRAWIDTQNLHGDNQSFSVKNNDNKSNKVIRGGSWDTDPYDCRCAIRFYSYPRDDDGNVGLRVVSAPPRT